MEIKLIHLKLFALLFILILFLFTSTVSFAAGGTISAYPASGNYTTDQEFTVSVKIDGGGQEFNAAKAAIIISPILIIQRITLGDCGFAFVKTPTKEDPSFAGVILGGSTKSCTVYMLHIKAINSGTGSVSFSDISIKSYKGASEILSSVIIGNYIIDKASTSQNLATFSEPNPTQPPIVNSQGIRLYNIIYTTSLPNNVSVSKVSVTLDPQMPNAISASPTLMPNTPKTITVSFQDVPEGVHTITSFYNNKPFSSQVINVSGNKRNIELGVSAKQQEIPVWVWYMGIATLVIAIGAVGFFGYKFYRKKTPKQ